MVGAVSVVISLVKGQDDEGVVVESGVGQERGQETREPLAGISDGGVVTIVLDVGGVERVVGEVSGLEVGLQLGRGDDVLAAGGVLGDEVKRDEGVVLAVVETLGGCTGVADRGHVLLVRSPCQTLFLQKVDDRLVGSSQVVSAVVPVSEVVSSDGGKVVGLGGVGHSVVVVQGNAAREEGTKGGVRVGQIVVLLRESKVIGDGNPG